MSKFGKLQARIVKAERDIEVALEALAEDLQQLLRDLDTALHDWQLTIDSRGQLDEWREASKRIIEAGGTLAYIAALRERIRRERG